MTAMNAGVDTDITARVNMAIVQIRNRLAKDHKSKISNIMHEREALYLVRY